MNKAMLIILDGYGEGKAGDFNAVKNAKTPTLDRLKTQSYSLLKADGESVGLFKNDLGGSEVGHLTIGAGRIVPSMLRQIHDSIEKKTLQKNKKLEKVIAKLEKNHGDLHLIGLCSDKNIHSNINHIYAIIDIFKNVAKNIYLHLITDGRDCGPFDSLKYIKQVQNKIKNVPNCHILSVGGRAYAMDRENNLDRTEKGFNAMFKAEKGITESEILTYIKNEHKNEKNDQFVEPIHVNSDTYTKVNKNDCLFFFNFREDRLRQLVKMAEKFNVELITMSNVGNTKSTPLFVKEVVDNTLFEYLSNKGLKQLKISESTKYAHVTYFLNGGREEAFKNEDRIHIPSHKVKDFSEKPKMRAGEITKAIKSTLFNKTNSYDFVVVNYSNPDMIGHTGDYKATVVALEYLDKCLAKVLKWAKKTGYKVLVTADHGNSEEMRTSNGEPHMAHTLNRVFCVVADSGLEMKKYGELDDVAPTILEIMDIEPNIYFEGKSLIVR